MRRLPLLLLLALASCGRDQPTSAPAANAVESDRTGGPAPAPAPDSASEPGTKAAAGAAETLRRYYDHIEAGRYDEAWAMRGGSGEEAEAFARNFASYERYRVTLGTPGPPVEANGWTFVEVPIQIFGRMKGGEPFGSAGSVTMRVASGAKGATPGQRRWHIYTG